MPYAVASAYRRPGWSFDQHPAENVSLEDFLVPFPAPYIWSPRILPSFQRRSRRNALHAMAVVAQRRRDRESLAQFLAERGIDAG